MADKGSVIYRRSLRHLAVIWAICIVTLVLIRWFDTKAPAFHELLIPFYWITLIVTVVFTWRWARARSRKERRGSDRRDSDRRHHRHRPERKSGG